MQTIAHDTKHLGSACIIVPSTFLSQNWGTPRIAVRITAPADIWFGIRQSSKEKACISKITISYILFSYGHSFNVSQNKNSQYPAYSPFAARLHLFVHHTSHGALCGSFSYYRCRGPVR